MLYNLAFALAQSGKRVLCIDADVQCNLTSAIFGLSKNINYDEANKEWWSFTENHTNLVKIVNAISNKNDDTLALEAKKVYKKEFVYEYKKQHSASKYQNNKKSVKIGDRIPVGVDDGCVHLLPAAIGLNATDANNSRLPVTIADLEFQLNMLVFNPSGYGGSVITDFPNKLRNIIAKDYDFVLIDTAPNASSMLNALMMFVADYFITPVMPTFFLHRQSIICRVLLMLGRKNLLCGCLVIQMLDLFCNILDF